MEHEKTTKGSGWGHGLTWAVFGMIIGAGVTAVALAKRTSAGSKAISETLDDLFRICESDCQDLESRLNSGNSQMAS